MRGFHPLVCSLLFIAGCGERGRSGIQSPPVPVVIERHDQALFHAPPDAMRGLHLALQERFGTFHRLYVERILAIGAVEDPRSASELIRFAQDPDWRTIQDRADSVLGDMAAQQALLGAAFGRLRTAFPGSIVPRPIAYNSGFNFGVFPTDSVLAFGVEWFVGPDHPVVRMLAPEAFPNYVKQRMVPEMLVPGAMKGWLMVHHMPDVAGGDLLDHLVATGKVMLLLEAVLPEVDPTLRFAFTADQLRWCERNEYNIWKELVAKELLYSKREADIGRFLNDGPFTSGLPRESPGHLGEWVGYRMVRAWKDAHPDAGFDRLFQTDARSILKYYRPR